MKRRTNMRSLHCEPLEDRRLMATLVNPTTLSYQDIDGDNVTVKFSKPILTSSAVANNIFDFSVGNVNNSNALKQQLREIDLGSLASVAGTTISVTAVSSSSTGGDGFAAIGQILADLDLGAVTIDGDLGRIDAGDANTATTGLAGLTVQSLGRYGIGATGATSLTTAITGRLGQLTVKGDVDTASVFVQGGANGSIGAITLKCSLSGDGVETGRIFATGDIGAVQVDGDIVGGTGGNSGSIQSLSGKIASLRVGGSLIGGSGTGSGRVSAYTSLGAATIQGSLVGGSGYQSGSLYSENGITSIKVGGSLIGGSGNESGHIQARGNAGPVTITGNLRGGTGNQSGAMSLVDVSRIEIGGSLLGGSGGSSGSVVAKAVTGVSKITGDVLGGSGAFSGLVYADKLNNLTIGGSVIGGTGNDSGSVYCSSIGTLTITGNLVGGNAAGSAELKRTGRVAGGSITTMTVGGSIIAGIDATSGDFEENGAVHMDVAIGSLTVKGSIVGNTTYPVFVLANRQLAPSTTVNVAIGSIRVDGRVEHARIRAGRPVHFAPPNADAQIGNVVVGGDWIASSITAGTEVGADGLIGTSDDTRVNGSGLIDLPGVLSKINSITIGGQVMGTVGGTDHFGFVAEIVGSFKVGGTTLPLLSGKSNDHKSVGITGDVRVHEI
jgi:hypothetical protein